MRSRNLFGGMVCVLFLIPVILQAQTIDSNSVVKTSTTKIHIVAKGETLYSIARKNHCKVEQIKMLNPKVDFNELKYGSKINVPFAGPVKVDVITNSGSARVKTLTETSVSSDVIGASGFFPVYHVVQKGETLLKIASQYHQKMATIRHWNHMSDNTILIGKKLIIGKRVNSSSVQTATLISPGRIISPDLVETTQKGVAEWESGTSSSNGMLFGLCSVVPIGSVVKITNPANNETIMVKITGNPSADEENANVLIEIPESAARQLNALNEKFVVQLSYFEQPQLSLK